MTVSPTENTEAAASAEPTAPPASPPPPTDAEIAREASEAAKAVATEAKTAPAGDAVNLSALAASIDSLPDRIVDAVREATQPAKAVTPPKAEKADVESKNEKPAAKTKVKSFRDYWFGE